jgi:hypothetical protein
MLIIFLLFYSRIKILYQKIVDHKINNLLNKYIDKELINKDKIQTFINDLIQTNFKGQYLKRELLKTTNWSFDKDNKATLNKNEIKDEDLKKICEDIKGIIKYDYLINGFEGLYINENIMGLIKYLSDEKLTGKKPEDVPEQKLDLRFQSQQRTARILLMTNNFIPELDDTTGTKIEVYEKMILELIGKQKDLLGKFNKIYQERDKFKDLISKEL